MIGSVRLLVIPLIFWICVYVLGSIHITDPIPHGFLLVLSPAMSSLNRLKTQIKNEFLVVIEARTLSNKYRALNEQNLQLRNEVAELTLLREENNKLREQLGSPELDKFRLIPAKIISKENGLTVVYDKSNEVTPGAVVVYKNNFVGKVKTATNRSATITLVTDPTIQIPVNIINQNKKLIKGIAVGQFGTGISLERVEQDEQIEKGDLIALDKAPRTPAGVIVGEIIDVEKIESELFQKAKIASFIQFDSLDTVFIIQ